MTLITQNDRNKLWIRQFRPKIKQNPQVLYASSLSEIAKQHISQSFSQTHATKIDDKHKANKTYFRSN